MCLRMTHIWQQVGPGWERVPRACGQCWQCRRDRMNDFVGRSLCEASTCEASCALTLTYAPRDDGADKFINPVHFQNFIKRLRKRGHVLRYLVAGEFGGLRDRTHFHCVLFFKRVAPLRPGEAVARYGAPAPLSREITSDGKNMLHISEWDHGHVYADWAVDQKAMRYVAKYVLKENGREWMSLSKKPPLGHEWFQAKARIARDLGVLPWSFRYVPPGQDPGDSAVYMMRGATRRNYLDTILPDGLSRPATEWVEKSVDKLTRWRLHRDWDAMEPAEKLAAWQEQDAYKAEGTRAFLREREAKRLDALVERTLRVHGLDYRGVF